MFPVPDAAEALEFLTLDIYELPRVGPAFLPGIQLGELEPLLLDVLLHLVFYGQAVAVPSRDIVRPVARHELRLDDDVLEDLVEGRPEVDIAVGVRGAVVEYEGGAVFSRPGHLPVEVYLLPAGKHVLFPDGQVASHGKGCLWEVQCVFVIHGRTVLAEIESNPAGSDQLATFSCSGEIFHRFRLS